eukprot:952539-Rhodomonas_salina.1
MEAQGGGAADDAGAEAEVCPSTSKADTRNRMPRTNCTALVVSWMGFRGVRVCDYARAMRCPVRT